MEVIVLASLLVLAALIIALLVFRSQAFRSNAVLRATEDALEQLERWRERDLAQIEEQQLKTARGAALVQLEHWKIEYERSIRLDAVRKSEGVTLGKVTEHFIPYLPDFSFNPKDARFLGSPIDFVVFDGLAADDVRSVVFVEVKTGTGALSRRERQIRNAVEAGRVSWLELRPQSTAPGRPIARYRLHDETPDPR